MLEDRVVQGGGASYSKWFGNCLRIPIPNYNSDCMLYTVLSDPPFCPGFSVAQSFGALDSGFVCTSTKAYVLCPRIVDKTFQEWL